MHQIRSAIGSSMPCLETAYYGEQMLRGTEHSLLCGGGNTDSAMH